MRIKVASFNISGGFYIGDESTEYLDREPSNIIDNKLLNEIIEYINKENIDIICFQEIITTPEINYIKTIVENTSLKFVEEFELSPCNLVKDTNCGLAILSRYPITECLKEKFTNPMLSKTTSSGNTYYTYDKGYIMIGANVNGNNVKVITHHGFPFRRFNSSPEENINIFQEFDEVIKKLNPNFITGDFNAENFMSLMNYTNNIYKRVFNDSTTVDGKKFDNILISKASLYNSKIVKSLSDHYLIIAEVDI